MARRTDPSADDWRNVDDAKKRKQIQDRLAQRARRKSPFTSSQKKYLDRKIKSLPNLRYICEPNMSPWEGNQAALCMKLLHKRTLEFNASLNWRIESASKRVEVR
jgi:hypothetical protein